MVKRTVCAALSVCICASCTWELRRSTLSVSSSITPIVEQQILENLSKAYDSPYFIPAQAVLSQGAIQIQNQGTVGMKLPYTVTRTTDKEVDPSVTLQWQETWTIVPVMDAPDIGRLQYLYGNAAFYAKESRFPTLLSSDQHYIGQYYNFSMRSGELLTSSCDGAPADGPSDPPPVPRSLRVVPKKQTSPKSHASRRAWTSPSSGASRNAKSLAPHIDPFQNCSRINALLRKANTWLAFDTAPPETFDLEHPDGFEDKGSFGHHRIWAKPQEFAQFTMFVLDAVPNTQSNATNGKGLSLSLQ